MNSPPDDRSNGAEVMIDVEALTRFYGTVPALRDVSFRAHRGEIVGFLGPNGAGKTTAMRILTGFMPPTSGRATVAGHDVVEESREARRAIGYLPETNPLYREMTVSGYLSFMARLRGVEDVETAVDKSMALVSVEDHADVLIDHLSKGYRQRVGVAQALVHDPPVVILDEPTIGLDPRQIREVRNLIRELGGDRTLIMSTHILPEAQQVCDRVLIISRGRIVAKDSPAELTARLSGGEEIRLELAPDVASAEVEELTKSVPGVMEVETLADGTYRVVAERGASPRPDLAAAVVGRGWPLLEISARALSLEDIFLQLTDEDEDEELVEEEADMPTLEVQDEGLSPAEESQESEEESDA